MTNRNRDRHSGSTFDSFLEAEGLLAETEAAALKRVLAWQLKQAMTAKRITKNAMAKQLHTSRSQVDRLLDPQNVGVSLETIARAAEAVGKRITLQIHDAKVEQTGARGRRKVHKREGKSLPKAG